MKAFAIAALLNAVALLSSAATAQERDECKLVAQLASQGRLDSIIVPFGDIDLDNDGAPEHVSTSGSGSSGAHSLSVGNDPADAHFTCYGCASVRTTKVQVVQIGARNYVIEFNNDMLSVLWEAEKSRYGWGGRALCSFAWHYSPSRIAGDKPELCKAMQESQAGRTDVEALPSPVWDGPRLTASKDARFVGYMALNTYRSSRPFLADIDNDGSADSLFRAALVHTGGGGCLKEIVVLAAGENAPEDSARNHALIIGQANTMCDGPISTPVRLNERTYLEVRANFSPEVIHPQSLQPSQSRPYWALFEFGRQGLVKHCSFDFDGRIEAISIK